MKNLKEIPGFSNYLADSEGNIYSKNFRNIKGNLQKLKPFTDKKGYLYVKIPKGNSKQKNCLVHRLIMLAFHGESDLQVNHMNGIKADNRLENLEYCSSSENHKHAFILGLKTSTKGEKSGMTTLTNKDVIGIKKALLKPYHGINKDLAKKYGVNSRSISNIKCGVSWSHIKIETI